MNHFCRSSGMPTPTILCMCPFCLRTQRIGQAFQGAEVVAKDPRDDAAAKLATAVLHDAARDPEIVSKAVYLASRPSKASITSTAKRELQAEIEAKHG